ncbi:MAG: hypothetical protein WBF13_13085 [Candidatus Zixiibacteriota bacterium]
MDIFCKAGKMMLDRPVRLKFLTGHLLLDKVVRRRLPHGAKAASIWDRTGITAIHETDKVGRESSIHTGQVKKTKCSSCSSEIPPGRIFDLRDAELNKGNGSGVPYQL